MNKRDREILDKFIRNSDNLQGAKYVLKHLKRELYANCTKDVDKDDDWKDDNIKTFELLKGARFSSNEEKINDDNCVEDVE